MANPDIKITLTIAEDGYHQMKSREFDINHPEVTEDIKIPLVQNHYLTQSFKLRKLRNLLVVQFFPATT
jgi:hypothetical protein